MFNKERSHSSIFGMSWSPANATLAIMLTLLLLIFLFLFMTLTVLPAQGQTYQVIYAFQNTGDGSNPEAGLTMDSAGNLYGTTSQSVSQHGAGTVFELSPTNSGWGLTTLYSFQGGSDGLQPWARVVFGPDGGLYGTTLLGGGEGCDDQGCGTVFKLAANPQGGWTETVLYRFLGGRDGFYPDSELVFDGAGNLYGTTDDGCASNLKNNGTVFKLTPTDGGWNKTTLYHFGNSISCCSCPMSGLAFDSSGNLYGTAAGDDNDFTMNYGGVYQLVPAGPGWKANILHTFLRSGDAQYPVAGVIFDASGNLYGATLCSDNYDGNGRIYMLSPSNGGWIYTELYDLPNGGVCFGGPEENLVLDGAGNLYGAAHSGRGAMGELFELSRNGSTWVYTVRHDFGGSAGARPRSNLIFDRQGNLYGTASAGGDSQGCFSWGCGVVFEITP